MGSDGGDGGVGSPLQEGPVAWYILQDGGGGGELQNGHGAWTSLQDGDGGGPLQGIHGADLNYNMVVGPLREEHGACSYIQDGAGGPPAGQTLWCSQLWDDVGGGPLQDWHGADLHYKLVMVGAPCRMDMVLISIIRWWW